MGSRRSKKPPPIGGLRSLTNVQVDVATRLGAVGAPTTTSFRALDALLGGGLRGGCHFGITGAPGAGKTTLALLLAYVAARSRASVLYTSVGMDETEVIARLTARALHREYENVVASYGTVWSGQSLQDAGLRGPITTSMNNVVKRAGDHLYLRTAEPMEDVAVLRENLTQLWGKSERVVLVVDGVEGFSIGSAAGPMDHAERIARVAYELGRIAGHGTAVITTCEPVSFPLIAPACSVAAELRPARDQPSKGGVKKKGTSSGRAVDLALVKNRLGPVGTLALSHHAAASFFEEREL